MEGGHFRELLFSRGSYQTECLVGWLRFQRNLRLGSNVDERVAKDFRPDCNISTEHISASLGTTFCARFANLLRPVAAVLGAVRSRLTNS